MAALATCHASFAMTVSGSSVAYSIDGAGWCVLVRAGVANGATYSHCTALSDLHCTRRYKRKT